MSWLPADLPQTLGVTVFKRDQAFLMADGRQITRDIGIALLPCLLRWHSTLAGIVAALDGA